MNAVSCGIGPCAAENCCDNDHVACRFNLDFSLPRRRDVTCSDKLQYWPRSWLCLSGVHSLPYPHKHGQQDDKKKACGEALKPPGSALGPKWPFQRLSRPIHSARRCHPLTTSLTLWIITSLARSLAFKAQRKTLLKSKSYK